MTTRTTWPLWQPPDETIETIAEVVAAHWNAAKASYRERLFWPTATSWLHDETDNTYHLTSGGKLIK
jgi:hypothetical protein